MSEPEIIIKYAQCEVVQSIERTFDTEGYTIDTPYSEIVCKDPDGREVKPIPEEILIEIFNKQQHCCENIAAIKKELEEYKAGYDWDTSWEIADNKCGDDEYDKLAGKASGFRALVALQMVQFQRLETIMQAVCGIESSFSMPEHWQIPMEARRPQLIINIAPRIDDDKFEPARWRVTIPHYDGNENSPMPFDYIDKGTVQGTEILNDNSKIICYARTEAEADRILDACLVWVVPFFAIGSQRKYTYHEDDAFQKVRMYPRRGTYWPFGKKIGNPDWTIQYPDPPENV